jgi:hypothetical protein
MQMPAKIGGVIAIDAQIVATNRILGLVGVEKSKFLGDLFAVVIDFFGGLPCY